MLTPLSISRPLNLSLNPQDAEKSGSRPERRRPRRHQQPHSNDTAATPRNPIVKMRGQFLCLLDSNACLTRLNVNNLCLTPLTPIFREFGKGWIWRWWSWAFEAWKGEGRANYETDGTICVFGVAWFCGVDSHFLNGVQ